MRIESVKGTFPQLKVDGKDIFKLTDDELADALYSAALWVREEKPDAIGMMPITLLLEHICVWHCDDIIEGEKSNFFESRTFIKDI